MKILKKGFSKLYRIYFEYRARRSTGWKLMFSNKLGLKLLLNLDNLIDFLISEKGVFEEEVIYSIDNVVRKEPFLFVDIGSQLGQFSLYVKKKYPQSEVLSFEPYKPAFFQQNVNKIINQLDYCLYEIALSNITGESMLYSPPAQYKGIYGKNNPGMTSLMPDLLNKPDRNTVSTTQLDDFKDIWERYNYILLKIDVEGGESLVLSGGRKLLRSGLDIYLIIELLFESLPKIAKEVDEGLLHLGFLSCNTEWKAERPENFKNGNYFYKSIK